VNIALAIALEHTLKSSKSTKTSATQTTRTMKVNNRRLQPGQLQQPRTTTTLHSSKTTVVKSVWRHAPTSHSSRASAAPSTTCVSARPALSRWRRWSVRCRYAAHGSTWFSVYISDSYRPTSLQAKITEEIYDIFTARRVCLARTMLWQDVCLSVCHTPVFCLNGYTYPQILNLYRRVF